jgi:cold shock CspA family protein
MTTTKRMAARVAVWYETRGFGFLPLPDSPRSSVFLHVRDCEGLAGPADHPNVGDLIEFTVIETPRGLRAVDARIIERVETVRR